MMKASKIALIATAIVAVAIWMAISEERDPVPPDGLAPTATTKGKSPDSARARDDHADEPSREWLLSPDAVDDPKIRRMAKIAGTTPACVIEALREQEFGIEATDKCTQMPPVQPEPPLKTNPTFEQYSDEQLKLLAEAEPDAAIILARRTADDKKARAYYEQALVLMGNARPMKEWIFVRDAAGLEWQNEELNVEKAKEAYEAWLIVEAFGGTPEPANNIEQELIANGVDPTPVAKKAFARIDELKRQRSLLFRGEN